MDEHELETVNETVDERKSGISCPICLGESENPRILPCGHVFCFDCISYWVKSQRIKKTFKCPVCRMKATIPKKGINGFITPYFDLIPTTVEETPASEPKTDSSAKPKTTENNFTSHPSQLDLSPFEKCSRHPDEINKWFCNDCQMTICQDCMIESHRLHTCVPGKEKDKESRIQRCIQSLIHTSHCLNKTCSNTKCKKLRRVMEHATHCTTQINCRICKQLKGLSYIHAKQCQNPECTVLYCCNIRHTLKQTRMPHLNDSALPLPKWHNKPGIPKATESAKTKDFTKDSSHVTINTNPTVTHKMTLTQGAVPDTKEVAENMEDDITDISPLTPQDQLIDFLENL